MTTGKVLRALALGGLLGLAGVATVASAATLKIGTEGGYPPWSMVDASNQVIGFDADVGHALCEKLGDKCRFVVQSFDSLIPALEAKRFDMVISGMSVTPERARVIAFSIPYASEDSAFVLPKDSPLVEAKDQDAIIAGLKSKAVGVQSGTTQAAFLAKYAPDVTVKDYETQDQLQMDLAAGRLAATFSEVTPQNEFVENAGKGEFLMAKALVKGSFDPDVLGPGIGVGMNQDSTELKARVDAALCELIQDGSIKRSSEKWFHADLSNYSACE